MPLAYLCDPELHGGERVGADYYVLPRRPDGHYGLNDPSFAACADHLLHAVRSVTEQTGEGRVEVRSVTGWQS